ncbi:CHAT domain-containing protein [Micromonospora sp. NPDC005599]|uniref:CHAT domain-containing protein n=1 Tax=Micromonospora sp. NPDC005599 TaxID=3155715 RepID=UPI0033A61E93
MTSTLSVRWHDPVAAVAHLRAAAPEDVTAALETLSRSEPPLDRAELLARAYARLRRYEVDGDPETLVRAQADFAAAAFTGPERAVVGQALVLCALHAAMRGQEFRAAREHATIDSIGLEETAAALLHGLVDTGAVLTDDADFDADDAFDRADELVARTAGGPFASAAVALRMALLVKRGQDRSFYDDVRQVRTRVQAMLDAGVTGEQRQFAEIMQEAAEILASTQRGETGEAFDSLQRLIDLVDRLPPDAPSTLALRRYLNAGAMVMEAPGGHTPGVEPAQRHAVDEPGLSAGERAFRLFVSGTGICRKAVDRRDADQLARGVAQLRRASDIAPADYPHRPMIDATLGRFLCARYELGAGREMLDEALRRLTTARRAAGDVAHPMWAFAEMASAHAYRLAGRRAEGRETGKRALRGHAWSVLLQAGTADATAAARHAVDDATEVARWCLADGDAGGAVAALDAGRCLMLYAATVTTGIPARLHALGHDELARRWQTGSADPDVRRDVLAVLTGAHLGDVPVPDVLDPPSLDQIRTALRAMRHDALVYLVPGRLGVPGAAVILPNGSEPFALSLPSLVESDDDPVQRYSRLLAARDAGEVGGEDTGDETADPVTRWRDALDRLAGWAWRVAIGPLLAETGRWGLSRAPRLLLVPMGRLAAVPWHAARDHDGWYAVQQAEFSYAPSARLLCENADRPPIPQDGSGLVVGDPTHDLPDARTEALAVRAAFYPDAELLVDDAGSSGASPTATPEAVLAWLRRAGQARPMLHLACHGAVGQGIDGSYLLLAGGARLTAGDLLEGRKDGAIGVVALAACTTSVPSGTFDEAFSLSTAFLAAGARTVFGSLWPVPSDATSLLMFMAHHYLRAEGRRPADALNRAQRWMADRERTVPAGMPAVLARRVADLDGDDLSTWAGFLHLGW